MLISLILFAAAAPSTAQAPAPPPASESREGEGAAALALFQRDAALNYWALKHYDADGDILLSPEEAAAAAEGFKAIADGDGDHRITPYEYARGREFIVARF